MIRANRRHMSETQVESAASARTIRCASVSAAKGTELVKGLCAAGVARGHDTRQGTPRRAAVAALMRRAVDDEADELRAYALALAEHELCAALAPAADRRTGACVSRAPCAVRRAGVRNVLACGCA